MTVRVAVTGVGAVTPYGLGVEATLANLIDNQHGDGVPNNGRCVDFAPADCLTPKEVRRNSRFSQLALVAALEAMNQAGMQDTLPYKPEHVCCAIGSGLGGVEVYDAPVGPLSVAMLMPSAAAAAVSMRFGVCGEVTGIAAACASGNQAIGAGYKAVRYGGVPAAIVGASDAVLAPLVERSFQTAGVLSPSGQCLPFNCHRDGFVMSEGAGILILENYDLARDRGATPLGFIVGYGASAEAHTVMGSFAGGGRTAQAMHAALQDANLEPGAIDYINAHGTGTELNDVNEIAALRLVFGDRLADIPLSSLKGQLGHLMGACGAVETILTLRMLSMQIAIPNYGLTEDDSIARGAMAICDYVKIQPKGVGGIALCNSFGFGGQNASVIVASEDYEAA